MKDNVINRVISDFCKPCTNKACIGPYFTPCEEFLNKLEEETRQCKTCKYNGQFCLGKSCEEGITMVSPVEMIKKADVMLIINAENAVVLNNLKERSTDEVLCAIVAQINALSENAVSSEKEKKDESKENNQCDK